MTTEKPINWSAVALIAIMALLVIVGMVQTVRLEMTEQELQNMRVGELRAFDPLCAEQGMGFQYITNGREIKCYNETTTAFFQVKLEETHRIEAEVLE